VKQLEAWPIQGSEGGAGEGTRTPNLLFTRPIQPCPPVRLVHSFPWPEAHSEATTALSCACCAANVVE
jgi:hypothetical protein